VVEAVNQFSPTEWRSAFPLIDWDIPIPITVALQDGSSLTAYACRFCIANFGIKASEIIAGETFAWVKADDFIEHMATVHQ
jgi:hypothetical protein